MNKEKDYIEILRVSRATSRSCRKRKVFFQDKVQSLRRNAAGVAS